MQRRTLTVDGVCRLDTMVDLDVVDPCIPECADGAPADCLCHCHGVLVDAGHPALGMIRHDVPTTVVATLDWHPVDGLVATDITVVSAA